MSTAKVENVVKPPQKPVPRSKATAGRDRRGREQRTLASAALPATFTAITRQWAFGEGRRVSRCRATPPQAAPAATIRLEDGGEAMSGAAVTVAQTF